MKIEKKKLQLYLGLLLICCLVVLLIFSTKVNWSAKKIFEKANLSHLTITEVETTSKGNYKSQIYYNDDVLKGVPYAGAIEVFRSPKEAMARKLYLETYNKALEAKISIEDFGPNYISKIPMTNEICVINNQVLFRFNGTYTDYQRKQLLKAFNKVLKQEWQIQTSFPSDDPTIEKKANEDAEAFHKNIVGTLQNEIKQIQSNLKVDDIDSLLKTIDAIKPYLTIPIVYDQAIAVSDKAAKELQKYTDEVETLLTQAADTYDLEILNQAEKKIETLTHTYFDDYKTQWNERIKQITWDIKNYQKQQYKDSCESYEYDDIMADPTAYEGTKAFFRGNVVETMGDTLRVNITPVYSFITDTILYWEDSILVKVLDKEAPTLTKGQQISMWGELSGITTMENLFGSQKALSFDAIYVE